MDAQFAVTPTMFGAVHIGILVFIAAVSVGLFFVFRRLEDKKLLRLLGIMGACMIAAEIWKLWFVHRYVYADIPSAWFFPWQLCSMAMYCSFAAPFLKGKAQDTVLVFLASFSLLAALFALAVPGDMLRPQIALFCHSFTYHAVMVLESLIAMLLLKRRRKAKFLPTAVLFLAMAAVAEVVNVLSHILIGEKGLEANMFNITPYWPSTQPVFHEIALALGIPAEIAIYLASIILGSFLIYAALYAARKKRKSASERPLPR